MPVSNSNPLEVVNALAFNGAGNPIAGVTPAGVLFGTGLQVSGPVAATAVTASGLVTVQAGLQVTGAIATPEGGSAPRMGTAVLNGTTAVNIPTTAVTAKSRVFLTIQSPGGTPGTPYVSSVTPGTGFAVKSAAGDTSTVAWLLVDHT